MCKLTNTMAAYPYNLPPWDLIISDSLSFSVLQMDIYHRRPESISFSTIQGKILLEDKSKYVPRARHEDFKCEVEV
jgi:hypothetical protein